MKVNMTPNPLDVVTIHASQGDTEAREWEFELHNNGELIDTSDVKEQLVFKAYKGGTEQILPENTSTPTTSPFKGDIKYPDATRTDQEFTYRQSPTEEDGLAKITEIKGNTLVWNQQIDSSQYRTGTYSSVAVTKSADETYLIANGTASAAAYIRLFNVASVPMISGHKYCCIVPTDQDVAYYDDSSPRQYNNQYSSFIFTSNGNPIRPHARINSGVASTNRRISFMMFDLTQMGLDSLTVEQFTSLFSLPYYAYNQGTLLSFMGNGIKTVGKNLFDFSQFANGTITFENGVLTGTAAQFNTSYRDVVNNGIELKYPENTQITISFDARTEQNESPSDFGIYLMASENGTSTRIARTTNETTSIQHITATIPSNRHIDKLGWTYGSSVQNIWHITNFQVEFGTETTYEPYASSLAELPISQYFSNGMKSAGNVYDELTESKAITRVGSVDLGSLNWTYQSSSGNMYVDNVVSNRKNNLGFNAICSKYQQVNEDTISGVASLIQDKSFAFQYSFNGRIIVRDTSYTDATVFKQAMADQNVKLYYELATPTETSFTTASLVTENAEIPLSNEDGTLIGKCTEELSENPGFIDAKIKLADADGECYSNKIQLHVERKPS